jgi:hypothetical protein
MIRTNEKRHFKIYRSSRFVPGSLIRNRNDMDKDKFKIEIEIISITSQQQKFHIRSIGLTHSLP